MGTEEEAAERLVDLVGDAGGGEARAELLFEVLLVLGRGLLERLLHFHFPRDVDHHAFPDSAGSGKVTLEITISPGLINQDENVPCKTKKDRMRL